MKKFTLILVVALGLTVSAQDKPSEPPQVPEGDKRTLVMLQQRAAGLTEAQAVLQKEIDAVVAELNRNVQRLQASAPAGYELSPQLTYVKKEVKK